MPQYLSHQRMGHACAFYDDPKQPYVIISGKMFFYFKCRYMAIKNVYFYVTKHQQVGMKKDKGPQQSCTI